MHCSRCQGLMLKEHVLDMEAGFREMWAQTWRCLSCGGVHDDVIEQNRVARQEKELTSGEPQDLHLGAETFIRPAA